MSHFSVMVVTPEKPDEAAIAKLLQPYHEFESTGVVDEYVVDKDITEEARKKYQEDTTRFYVDPNGIRHDPYKDEFYRDPTDEEKAKNPHMGGLGWGNGISWNSKDWGDGKGYRTKVHFVPEGWQDIRVQDTELKTFAQYVEDYYEYERIPAHYPPDIQDKNKRGWYRTNPKGEVTEVIKRTNESAKWDWYVIGGRWAGLIKLKEGSRCMAWNGTRSRWDDPTPAGRYDSARKGDIDIEGLRSARKAECAAEYDAVYVALGQYITPEFLTWEKMVAKHNKNYDTAREEYGAQELVVKAKEYGKSIENHWFDIDSYCIDRDTYMALKEISGFSTFAILKDGQWHERGEMHMWGMVSEEKAHWEFQFEEIFKTVPDDHWVTIVDCHI